MERDEPHLRHPVARLLVALVSGFVAVLLLGQPIVDAGAAELGPIPWAAVAEPIPGEEVDDREPDDLDDSLLEDDARAVMLAAAGSSAERRSRRRSTARTHPARGPPAR